MCEQKDTPDYAICKHTPPIECIYWGAHSRMFYGVCCQSSSTLSPVYSKNAKVEPKVRGLQHVTVGRLGQKIGDG